MFNSVEELIDVVRQSILFDAEWYKETYQIGEVDAAEHYVVIGWKKNYNPSIHFSTQEYLDRNPDVYETDICPLLHYEAFGLYEKRRVNIYHTDKLREKYPECTTDLSGGIMRLRITNRCPGKCRYCGQLAWSEQERQRETNSEWYYEYCEPLYEKLKLLLVTGGDAFSAKESYNFMKKISEEYPNVTIATESNGMPFNKKYQELAAENLFMTHFSVNASNAEVFAKSCWAGENAEMVYNHILENIRSYISLLEEKDLLCFAPNYSMVINKDNADDVCEFVRLCLELKATNIGFYFDYTESNMGGEYFSCPETSRRALQTMIELERVLSGKIFMNFRLWIPLKELEPMQIKVDAMDINELNEKYKSVLELADGRDILKEHQERNRIRRERGKSELTLDEDFNASLRKEDIAGKRVCFSPWKMIDIYPTGRMDFCSWFIRTLNMYDFIQDGAPDWNEILNHPTLMMYRKHMLNGIYKGCMDCCPMNASNSSVSELHMHDFTCE